MVEKKEIKKKEESKVEKVKHTKAKKTNAFIKVRCHKCGNEQIIFGKASSKVVCLGKNCDEVLATPRGGKATINAEILEVV